MTVSWTAPSTDGGSPITGYIIERCDTSTRRWFRVNKYTVKDLSYTVSNLHEGNEYMYRVSAENAAGASKPSEESAAKKAKPPYGEELYFTGLFKSACRRRQAEL